MLCNRWVDKTKFSINISKILINWKNDLLHLFPLKMYKISMSIRLGLIKRKIMVKKMKYPNDIWQYKHMKCTKVSIVRFYL